MKRLLNAFFVLVCIIGSIFTFSACGNSKKYTYEKYEDIAYGDYERQKFDLYLPNDCEGTVGLIFVIHGGAWIG